MTIQEFLNGSYTAYHTTANVVELLKSNGFVELTHDGKAKKWNLVRGGKYFVTRNGSSVIAFVVGKNNVFNVCESHTDSPSFKVKGARLVESEGVKRLNTEKYGGGLLYSYLDRPLKIAGRVVVETQNGVQSKVVTSDYNVVIPSLAIHHNPTANDSLLLNPQLDTLPMLAQNECELYATLTDGKVLDADLYVVPDEKAFISGVNGEFLSSPRLDNLTSVYTSIQAILTAKPNNIAVVSCLDNEEIGSGTRQGSPNFINQVLDAIAEGLNMSYAENLAARENGMVLSVDNGHAIHPAHPEKSDPLNRVHLNGGVVIKHHTNYATDGLTSAAFKRLLDMACVKYQDYYNRSDLRCGTTLGLATANRTGMKTCDIGIAQLAMHSACETCGVNDIETMQKALGAFVCANINGTDNITIKM
ncbi:MAG: M18 family aminopeptidase [Clostridiales bacterium]|nr:M18 family aminopeptidase [Clostridiales bacterium]